MPEKSGPITQRMQFTDMGSYYRIWEWMGECGDTHQQAGEVIFSTPNMHWPGQVARPGDWIVRTPHGFVAEPPSFSIDDETLNGYMENSPEEIDGDVAMEELVLRYIHWLEDQVPGVSTRIRNAKCGWCPDHGFAVEPRRPEPGSMEALFTSDDPYTGNVLGGPDAG